MPQVSSHWTQKYQPTQLSDIVGNARCVRELREWLRNFGQQSAPIMFLYGPSGIGKTVLASLLFRQYNYYIFELNAGEIRSKKRVHDLMDKILSNYSVSMMKRRVRQRVIGILMDEIDGMSCGDRGGLHELFQMVSAQHDKGLVVNPVICISNRPYDKKIPENLYREVAMRRPTTVDIFKRLRHVIATEKLHCDDMALQLVIQHSDCDVRKCLNFLQEVSLCFPGEPIELETVQMMQTFTQKKQPDFNIFDVTRAIFRVQRPLHEVQQLYRVDTNLIPMMIHENLPYQMQYKKISQKVSSPEYLFLMHNLALSDVLTNAIMQSARSELEHSVAMLSCGYVNERMSRLPSKSSAAPKTVFTNTLTKSATQSNTHMFISALAYKLGIPSTYCIHLLPTMVEQFIAAPHTLCTYNIDHIDIEKILQIYQKWTSKKVAAKDKKQWKKILQKRS